MMCQKIVRTLLILPNSIFVYIRLSILKGVNLKHFLEISIHHWRIIRQSGKMKEKHLETQIRPLKSVRNSDFHWIILLSLFSCQVVSDCLWPHRLQQARFPCHSPSWTSAHQTTLSFTISWSLFKLMSIVSVMPSNHLILCCPLLLPPSIFPSIRVFSNESALLIRWPMYWSFSFSIGPSSKYSGLISFRLDWLDLLAVHGTLKSLLQLQKHQFFSAQLSLSSNSHIHMWLLEKP